MHSWRRRNRYGFSGAPLRSIPPTFSQRGVHLPVMAAALIR
jgi:hypothetical protein